MHHVFVVAMVARKGSRFPNMRVIGRCEPLIMDSGYKLWSFENE